MQWKTYHLASGAEDKIIQLLTYAFVILNINILHFDAISLKFKTITDTLISHLNDDIKITIEIEGHNFLKTNELCRNYFKCKK